MDSYSIETCHMPQEYTIVFIYLTFIMIILFFKVIDVKQYNFINNYYHLFKRKKSYH